MTTRTVIETYDDEARAIRDMHKYAKRLRRQRLTGRYGVTIERRAGSWWLELIDRSRGEQNG